MDVSGDLGQKRGSEASKAFRGLAGAGNVPKNPLPMGKPRLMRMDYDSFTPDPKGPDTMGGVIGGKYDSGNYSGVKAGGRKRK